MSVCRDLQREQLARKRLHNELEDMKGKHIVVQFEIEYDTNADGQAKSACMSVSVHCLPVNWSVDVPRLLSRCVMHVVIVVRS